MKKSFILLLFLMICASVSPLCASASDNTVTRYTETVFWENVGTMETEEIITVYLTDSNEKSVSQTKIYKIDGVIVAAVTLNVAFGYDGNNAWVINTSVSKNVSGGWTYSGQSIDVNGGSVTLTAQLSHASYATVPVEIFVSCTPSGVVI